MAYNGPQSGLWKIETKADMRKWQKSYEYLPVGSGEEEIANASTAALRAAHGLMEASNAKARQFTATLSPEEILHEHADGTGSSYFRRLVLDESLRYARVCWELGTRFEVEDAEKASVLLRSALLPGSCFFAFENHAAYKSWWDKTVGEWDRLSRALEKLTAQVRDLLEEPGKYTIEYRRDLSTKWLTDLGHWKFLDAQLNAAFNISEKQDAWNFRVKVALAEVEKRLGHTEETRSLRKACLDLLDMNDDLWNDLTVPPTSKSIAFVRASARSSQSVVEEFEATLNQVLDRVLDSKLEPLLKSVEITHGLHDRLDFVVEKLIDLDQRSALTWQHIRQSALEEPSFEERKSSIESSLASLLGAIWRRLDADSRDDLVVAEFVFRQCAGFGSGWRMPVMAYCTTAERELRHTTSRRGNSSFPREVRKSRVPKAWPISSAH